MGPLSTTECTYPPPLMADQRLEPRLHQLLHERPDYERLMSAAWNNTTTSLSLNTRAQYFNARAALYLTQEYENFVAHILK